MPGRKVSRSRVRKVATTKKRAKPSLSSQYVTVKDSCKNLDGLYTSEEAAVKSAKANLEQYGYGYSRSDKQDFVTICKLVPVKVIRRQSQFTEEDLTTKKV